MRRRLSVVTVGCKANFADSAGIASRAVLAGFEVVPGGEPADVVVVNGCTVTHRADRDSRSIARRLRRESPGAVLVMTGCFAETSLPARSALPEIDHWVGIGDASGLHDLLRSLSGGSPPRKEEPSLFAADRLLGRSRTFLKVQDGCDAVCAYCIVPMARGGSRSVPLPEVLAQVVRAESEGAREFVLTGIHVGRYGQDRGERDGLALLLAALLSSTSLCRFRLGSVEPLEVTPHLTELLAGEARVCPHLHVPLQSGSDRILSRMRRPYTAERYCATLQRLSSDVPGIRLGADVIAGFPGETAGDFGETMELIRGLPLSYLHAFSYSPRAGTESAGFRDDVAAIEKKRRVNRLREMDAGIRRRYLEGQVGRTLSVVVESGGPGSGPARGTSENYAEVEFPAGNRRAGEIVPVRILAVRGTALLGKAAD